MSIIESILKQSDKLQSEKSRKDRKGKGVFYTPPEIVERMTEKVLGGLDLSADPYVRILDPACGSGLFLIKTFQVLKDKFEKNLDVILDRNKELEGRLQKDDIGSFIVENNLWGADIDRKALDTAGEILTKLAGKACRPNLTLCDSLLYRVEGEYDYILGNPPYIGHKQVSGEYKKVLQQLYKGIYRDKSDISYCFFKKGIELLKEGGSLSFITSRYFMEGPSASGLRNYITGNCTVSEIIDFYGDRVFQEAGVAACIITLRKGSYGVETSVLKHKQRIKSSEEELFAPSSFEHFDVGRSVLKDEGWVLLSPEKYEIFSALEAKSGLALGDIANNYQGIITGCDRAFIVDKNEIEAYGIEEPLLKPWIKNSNILKHDIKAATHFLIYSDFIKTEEDFPNAVKYISHFRDRLITRRECRRGIRKWYELQWGRTNEVFDTPKIVYPYKSGDSRFAVDETGFYHSADIYNLKLKKEYEKYFSLDYLAAILNSRLFEFYFKCYAKKISKELYDYYPNTVLRMKISVPDAGNTIQQMACELKNCKNEDGRKTIIYETDREVYKLYGLNKKQIEIVENNS